MLTLAHDDADSNRNRAAAAYTGILYVNGFIATVLIGDREGTFNPARPVSFYYFSSLLQGIVKADIFIFPC